MSLDGFPEQQATLAYLAANVALCEGRAYDYIPEETEMVKDALGLLVKPYLIVTFAGVFPKEGDRSIEGPEQQPQVMPVVIECWSPNSIEARQMAGQVRVALTGRSPDANNAEAYDMRGGNWFDRRDTSGRPTRYCQTVTGATVINNSVEV